MKGWIPRSPSEKADCLGKIVDYNDREIVAKILQLLNNRWGHHTVDRFATFYITKLRDSFQVYPVLTHLFQAWQGENCCMVPPVVLLFKVLKLVSLQGPGRISSTILPFCPLILGKKNRKKSSRGKQNNHHLSFLSSRSKSANELWLGIFKFQLKSKPGQICFHLPHKVNT